MPMTMTYKATAVRGTGEWWEIEITEGLPEHMSGFSQCRRLDKVEETARHLIADLLERSPESVSVDVEIQLPNHLRTKLQELDDACAAEQEAQNHVAQVRAEAAAALVRERLTMREAGQILGLSHQRVSQLVQAS